LGADEPSPERWHFYDQEFNANGCEWNANGHESFGDVVFFRCMVGTLARSATGSCDERVSGSGSGDASEVCVEGTFVGTFARSAIGEFNANEPREA
jgi:hypothetical protein